MSHNEGEGWIRPIRRRLTQLLGNVVHARPATGDVSADDATSWTHTLLQNALDEGASDIHIASQSDAVLVRWRVDGTLFDVRRLTIDQGRRLMRHLKTMADLDAVATFKPQTARRTHQIDGRQFDIRLACAPTIHGEKMTLRVLNPQRIKQEMKELGISISLNPRPLAV